MASPGLGSVDRSQTRTNVTNVAVDRSTVGAVQGRGRTRRALEWAAEVDWMRGW